MMNKSGNEEPGSRHGELVPADTVGALQRHGRASAMQPAPTPPGGDDEFPVRRYVQIMRDRWATILTVFVVVAGGVAAGSLLRPPTYRATGAIEIRKQAAEVVPMDALFQFERISEQYLQTEYATLRSRALVQRALQDSMLVTRLLLHLGRTPESGDVAEAGRIATIAHRSVIIDPVTGSRIVRVSFDSPDPQLSADMVNALVAQYAMMRRETGGAALEQLDEQTDSVRTHLLAAEQELQEFVRQSGLGAIVIGGSGGETVPQERLRRLQQELTEAEAEGYRASAVAASSSGAAAVLESELLSSLRRRISELEGEHARLRSTFTDSFPRVKQLRNELAQIDALIVSEQRRVSSAMTNQHEATIGRRALLQRAVNEQQRLMEEYAVKLAEYERRRRDIDAQTQLYTTLQQTSKEASLSAALAAMDIAVLDAAVPPSSPISPRPARDIPLGVIVGLFLGIGLAFLREFSDGSLKTAQDAGEFGNVPLLAMIPSTPLRMRARRSGAAGRGAGSTGWHRIDRSAGENPQLAEAFRGLRTSVLFDAGGELPRTLLVTSSVPGEGKTTVSTNLAISMAMMGRRVLLVDADMRRPSLHNVFGVARQPGLSDQLAGYQSWARSFHRDASPGLDLITAGTSLGNPSDMLSTSALSDWLADVSAAYDLVVIDAPALHINVPDGRILANAADGVLLVVRSRSTQREVVRRLVAQTPNLVGIVLNQLDMKSLPLYYGEYGQTAQAGMNANGNGRHRVGRTGGSPPKADVASDDYVPAATGGHT